MNLCPFSYFANSNGAPNAGGFIHTYVAGTSSEKPTYTDNTGSTPLTNPIVIPANGIVYIWMATDSAYKLVIQDSATNPLNTIDQVVPITSFSAIAGGSDINMTGHQLYTTGNGNIVLAPGGSGAVTFNGIALPTSAPSVGQLLQATSSTTTAWGSVSAASLSTLTDATITSPAANNILQYNGSKWVNLSLAGANIAAANATWTSASITDLGSSSVTFTNKAGNVSQWTNDSGYVTATSATAFTNKTGAISQWTNDSAYLTSVTGSIASKATCQTGTSTTTIVSPGHVIDHPCIPKVIVSFLQVTSGTGTMTLQGAQYGVSSVTRVSANLYTINFSTNFADTTYTGLVYNAAASGSAAVIAPALGSANVSHCNVNCVGTESLNNVITVWLWGTQ